ncbi:MAG: hypothetical protein MJZ56_06915 [Bacteroidales bacterium]|nr:hypothetical protein [Bacteroidales bacterium]
MKWEKMRDVIVSVALLFALMVPLAAIGQYDLGYDYGTIWDNKNVGGNGTNNYAKWEGMKDETPMSSGLFGLNVSWETLRQDEPKYYFVWYDMNDDMNDAMNGGGNNTKWVDIEDVTPVGGGLITLTAPWNVLGLNEPENVGDKGYDEGEGVEWEKMKDADEGVEWEKMEDVTPVGSGLIVLTVASVCYVGIKKRKHLKIRKLKKVLLIMAAALMTMTQCRKQETGSTARTVKMTITAGPGAKTDINEGTGAITWSADDKLYVSDGNSWRGILTLESGAGSALGTFTGTIDIGEGTTYHFFYFGHDNDMPDLPIGEVNEIGINFGSQSGTLDDAMRYHMGHGKTGVTVDGDKATGHVMMSTKIAIAHFNFITDDAEPYTGSVTMSGDFINNYMYFYPNGNFYGSEYDGITINDGDGISGDRYVTLIPIGEDAVEVEFIGDATGSMTFQTGILENKFYGMSKAIEVTLKRAVPKFSVSANTTVEFAPGNLYYDGSAFHFETSQTAYTSSWNSNRVDHFLWSPNKDVAVDISTSSSSGLISDVFFTNATKTTASPSFRVSGEDAGTWRTLSRAEWMYLLGVNNSSHRRDANRFAKAKVNGVNGLLIFPDGYNNGVSIVDGTIVGVADVNVAGANYPSSSIPDDKWAEMESSGVVFLPAAGYRNGTEFTNVGSDGYYWASDAANPSNAYSVYFHSGNVNQNYSFSRIYGSTVRLVR